VTAVNPESGLTTYLYDSNNSLLSRTDNQSVVTSYTYNRTGHVYTGYGAFVEKFLKSAWMPDCGVTAYRRRVAVRALGIALKIARSAVLTAAGSVNTRATSESSRTTTCRSPAFQQDDLVAPGCNRTCTQSEARRSFECFYGRSCCPTKSS
jgi:YD repeat-containing protein